MEIISSDLTDVMRRVEPSQVITEQSQFLTININLELQKQREREERTHPGYLLSLSPLSLDINCKNIASLSTIFSTWLILLSDN